MNCKNCGESLEGNGYSKALHCPNTDENSFEFNEPDANPVYCDTKVINDLHPRKHC
jgi:hypothetical protein